MLATAKKFTDAQLMYSWLHSRCLQLASAAEIPRKRRGQEVKVEAQEAQKCAGIRACRSEEVTEEKAYQAPADKEEGQEKDQKDDQMIPLYAIVC